MFGAALQSVRIKDRLTERLAAKTAAPRRRSRSGAAYQPSSPRTWSGVH